jgi:hypothetical protein
MPKKKSASAKQPAHDQWKSPFKCGSCGAGWPEIVVQELAQRTRKLRKPSSKTPGLVLTCPPEFETISNEVLTCFKCFVSSNFPPGFKSEVKEGPVQGHPETAYQGPSSMCPACGGLKTEVLCGTRRHALDGNTRVDVGGEGSDGLDEDEWYGVLMVRVKPPHKKLKGKPVDPPRFVCLRCDHQWEIHRCYEVFEETPDGIRYLANHSDSDLEPYD